MIKRCIMRKILSFILILAVFSLLAGCELALHQAVVRGDIDAVNAVLNQGFAVNTKDNNGNTALIYAAAYGNTEAIKLLIDKGADVNAKNNGGWNALGVAAGRGQIAAAKFLMDKGADIDYAIAKAEASGNKNEVAFLERIKPKQPASQGISKEELKTIVQTAIESTKTQKEEKNPIIKTDIDKPTFAASDKIMGDNDLAVIIGIEGYQNIPKSDYSYDDAKLVGDYAKALGFKPRNMELLLDERATKSAIEKIIKTWLPNKAKPDSRVFVYYSGHGAPEPKTGDAYIVPFDGDPNYLPDTGYPLKTLYDNLGKLQVAEVTVVLDACFSGAGGRSVLAKGARPLVMMAEGAVISQNMAVLSAAQGTQISTSSPEKGHGVFTYYFLKALKDGKKDIAEIYEYIKPLVEDEAKQLNVQQSPSISPDVEKLKGRFGLRK